MILAWLLLLTGLTISAVAIYYSVVGLAAIFSAAVIPIIIMGSALEVGKLVCASWLKANWERAPRFMKYYMIIAVTVLMVITSMGIFGFLSKAHNDQNLVSGDVQSKIAIYDEKIRTAKENIEANRKQLKQMDEAVDQVMARSSDEKGADKANNIRRSQQRDRSALAKDIEANQKIISQLNNEAAPIRAEIRKVEAEVGPIKYIAKFIYGEKGADENFLERAVTWIIILIVIVFDPLAVIMLLAAQMTFGWMREQKQTDDDPYLLHKTVEHTETKPDAWIADVGEKPTKEELEQEFEEFITKEEEPVESAEVTKLTEESKPPRVLLSDVLSSSMSFSIPKIPTVDETEKPVTEEEIKQIVETIKPVEPVLAEKIESLIKDEIDQLPMPVDQWNKMIEEAEAAVKAEQTTLEDRVARGETYIDGAGNEVKLEADLPEDDSKKKTYMMKDQTGQIQTLNRE